MLPPGRNWTERVRRLAEMAQREAARLGHSFVEPLHLAQQLTKDDGVASTALRLHGTDVERSSRYIAELLGDGTGQTTSAPPLSAETLTLLEQASIESRELSHSYIGTEHILLAMLRDSTTPLARLLGRDGCGFNEARQRILMILDGNPSALVPGPGQSQPR